MEGRTLRERKGVSYDEKALEAKQYEDAFDFADTDEEAKKGKKKRYALVTLVFLHWYEVHGHPSAFCCGLPVLTPCRTSSRGSEPGHALDCLQMRLCSSGLPGSVMMKTTTS